MHLRDYIRNIPDFPKDGIVFRDITPLMADAQALDEAVRQLAEIARPLTPDVVVAAEARGFLLGATAAQSVMGPAFRVSKQRGEVLESTFGIPVLATVHPSSILRATDDESRDAALASLIADLKVAASNA